MKRKNTVKETRSGMIADKEYKIESEVVVIPVDEICPDPNQPRKFLDPVAMGNLVNSLHTWGQQTPAWVRPLEKPIGKIRYMLISGERRWTACPLARINELRCVVFKTNDPEYIRTLQAIENSQREPLTVLENCNHIKLCVKDGMPPAKIMKLFGKSLPWVYQHINILELHPEALKFLGLPTAAEKQISFATAMLLLDVEKKLQPEVASQISEGSMTMIEAKAFIRREVVKKTGKSAIVKPKREFDLIFGHVKRMSKWLDTMIKTEDLDLSRFLSGVLPESRTDLFTKLIEVGDQFKNLKDKLEKVPITERKKK